MPLGSVATALTKNAFTMTVVGAAADGTLKAYVLTYFTGDQPTS